VKEFSGKYVHNYTVYLNMYEETREEAVTLDASGVTFPVTGEVFRDLLGEPVAPPSPEGGVLKVIKYWGYGESPSQLKGVKYGAEAKTELQGSQENWETRRIFIRKKAGDPWILLPHGHLSQEQQNLLPPTMKVTQVENSQYYVTVIFSCWPEDDPMELMDPS
jgi:hypothetical protein